MLRLVSSASACLLLYSSLVRAYDLTFYRYKGCPEDDRLKVVSPNWMGSRPVPPPSYVPAGQSIEPWKSVHISDSTKKCNFTCPDVTGVCINIKGNTSPSTKFSMERVDPSSDGPLTENTVAYFWILEYMAPDLLQPAKRQPAKGICFDNFNPYTNTVGANLHPAPNIPQESGNPNNLQYQVGSDSNPNDEGLGTAISPPGYGAVHCA